MASLGIIVASNVDVLDKNLTIQGTAKKLLCFGNKNNFALGTKIFGGLRFFPLQCHADSARLLKFQSFYIF